MYHFRFICIIAALVCGYVHQVHADTVEFSNGQILQVVILSENNTGYKAQCDVGTIEFTKDRVTHITKATPEENKQLLMKWEHKETPPASYDIHTQQPLVEKKNLPPIEAPDTAQKQTILYNSRWITKEEYKKIKDEKVKNWQERLLNETERTQTEQKRLVDEKRYEETEELIAQGTKRRSNEANTILSLEKWKSIQSDYFTVFYTTFATGEKVADKAEFFIQKIATDLGIERDLPSLIPNRIEIYVIESDTLWQTALGGKYLPDTPYGFSKVYKQEIFLYVTNDYDIEFVLPHEMSHILLRLYTNITFSETAPIPLWLYEGFANFEGRVVDLSASRELLLTAIRRHEQLPLSDILTTSEYPRNLKQKTLFYAEATEIINYIYTTYGRLSFIDFIFNFLKEYYAAAQTNTSLSQQEGKQIFERTLAHARIGKELASYSIFEENWLKSIMK